MNVNKYSLLTKKYNKIKGIYNEQIDVIKFIHNCSFENIKPFPHTKILSFHDYKYKYFERHKKISEFYGDFTEETYGKMNKNFQNF